MLYTRLELAKALGVGVNTLTHWRKLGAPITADRRGQHWQCHVERVKSWAACSPLLRANMREKMSTRPTIEIRKRALQQAVDSTEFYIAAKERQMTDVERGLAGTLKGHRL